MIKKLLYTVMVVCILASCTSSTTMSDVAGYVADPGHGLVKEEKMDGEKVICQWVPDSSVQAWLFRVYVSAGNVSDSTLYKLNYHAEDMFRLVQGKDTLKPVLSERVANGKRNQHEFTVVFNPPPNATTAKNFSIWMPSNGLLPKDIFFQYQYNDITKALKKLYGNALHN